MNPTIKTIPIGAYPESAWRMVLGVPTSSDADISTIHAYRSVVAVHRCVKARAKAVKGMPLALYRGKKDISTTPDGAAHLAMIRELLYRSEASVCVYGAAYALRVTGKISGTPRLRWITSASITPRYSDTNGLEGFTRAVGDTKQNIPLDEIWYAWLPDLAHDVGPDVAPVAVALQAADVLANLDRYLDLFFAGGALPVTLIRVKGNPPEGERKKLESWFKSGLTGLKNAFSVATVSADVEPVTIGNSLTDTLDMDMVNEKTQEILIAMEVPASLVLPDAANYATARQDAINFYNLCVIPETDLFIDALNTQYLLPTFGYELVAMPERLEVFQQSELDKGTTLVALTGGPILTQSEGRQRLELAPLAPDQLEQERLETLNALAVMAAATAAGYNVTDAAALAGLPPPTIDTPPPPPPPAMLPPPPDQETPPDPTDDSTLAAVQALADQDLDRWYRKCLKRLEPAPFESQWIDPAVVELIAGQLERIPDAAPDGIPWSRDEYKGLIARAFRALPVGSDLSPAEQRLYDALLPLLGKVPRAIIDSILAGELPNLAALSAAEQASLMPALLQVALETALATSEAIGVDMDPAVAATTAGDWARSYSYELVRNIDSRTQAILQHAVGMFLDTPNMDQTQLAAILQGAFSPRRAETIAITESTRAAAAAQSHVQQHLAAAGITTIRVWQTVKQDVCPICKPLDNKPESDWLDRFPGGPPGHPRCRCAITLRIEQ